ncbi:MAG: hypothetical protein IJI14_17395 [Anaerolineaceae bacterium]|nr:hypothetical protein [Anaerolineaceae bacterium]
MEKKKRQCYFLLGNTIMLILSCICFFFFINSNLEQIADKNNFESIYVNTSIDFIIPGPSYSQIKELENDSSNGIAVVTPYYETSSTLYINGTAINGNTLLFPFQGKMDSTPYGYRRIISGEHVLNGGNAVVDQAYVDKYKCKIGDIVRINIADHEFSFTISSIAETNTYYKDGTIALILTESDADKLYGSGIKYSSAYVSASDIKLCEQYLTSEYKPLSRLKEESEFESNAAYIQHLQNFNQADWSREITNCQKNYNSLSVKYNNFGFSICKNLLITAALIIFGISVFTAVLLTKDELKNFMKSFLLRKSGTKDSIKAFYKSGITENCVFFCVVSLVLYSFLSIRTGVGIWGAHIVNLIIPILVAIFVSLLMVGISKSYVESHYKVKVVQRKDHSEEIQVEVI